MTAAGQLPDRLRAVLAATLNLDEANVTIANLRPAKRNSKRAMWTFDAATPHGRGALLVSLDLVEQDPTHARPELRARAQVAAAACGVPVPRIVTASDSAAALGSPFVISEIAQGVTDYTTIVAQLDKADPRAGRARLLRECAKALARIHRIETADAEESRQDRLKLYRTSLDSLGATTATLEWAFRWLATHQPSPSPAVLVHGDYRMGNLLVDGSGLTAVLDWDWLHFGEAYEDLAWFCIRAWRYGAPSKMGAGGLGSIESFVSAYEEASGSTIDRVTLHWWLVMATLLNGITLCAQAQARLTEKVPTMRMTMAGRRVCEVEWDLLNLLDEEAP